MGSWSVYCGISNITITAGTECALIPLKKNDNMEGYLPYLPATLPIFGEYDDYGGIENIIEDDNTKLIEEHFGITISEFCQFLVDGKFTYDREEVNEIFQKVLNINEIENMRFMWIDKKVYDFMSTYLDDYTKGHLHFGNPEFMKALGFEYVGEDKNNNSYDPNRFCHVWKHGDKYFLADGWTMLSGNEKKSSYVYHVNPKYSDGVNALSTYITIPDNMKFIADKAEWQLWQYNKKHEKTKNLSILGMSNYSSVFDDELFREELRLSGVEVKPKKYDTLLSKYKRDYEMFADRVAELLTIRHNLRPMSGSFQPHQLYLTPQCGEHRHHQVLLDKFSEINKSYIEMEEIG